MVGAFSRLRQVAEKFGDCEATKMPCRGKEHAPLKHFRGRRLSIEVALTLILLGSVVAFKGIVIQDRVRATRHKAQSELRMQRTKG